MKQFGSFVLPLTLAVLVAVLGTGCPNQLSQLSALSDSSRSHSDSDSDSDSHPAPDPTPTPAPAPSSAAYVVLAHNDLGMHCMNEDFSEFMILPPYNTVRAQVIRRGEEPKIITSGVQVNYVIPSNTSSVNKTNFWTYAPDLFGVTLPPDVGLTGNGLKGAMTAEPAAGDWVVTGIPVTPINDANQLDPYPLATISATKNGQKLASSQAVVPVSWEISCDICHSTPGISVATDILRAHDRMHGTTLETQKPVVCGSCHAQPPLGLAGVQGVPSLSSAIHSAHASRMAPANLAVDCYACHPGFKTQCLRDIHYKKGLDCVDCHGGMQQVGDPSRQSWQDEPRCGDCHNKKGHEYEQTNTLFRDSKGHHGVSCSSCHGSPHAITPTVNPQDNVQAIALQGHAGTIDTCTVCHTKKPDDSFDHRFSGGDKAVAQDASEGNA